MPDSDKDKQQKPSGHVRHDPGGRAVWQWAIDSGKHAIESTSRLLKRLDLSHLSILDDDEKEKDKGTDPDKQIPTFGGARENDPLAGKRQGFDPYNTRTPIGRGNLSSKPKTPPKPRITQPVRHAQPAKKPGLFASLFGGKK